MRTLTLSVAVLMFAASDACSQWGSRGCGPQGPVSPTNAREWKQLSTDPGRWHVFVHGQQAGAFCPREGVYRDYHPARGWSDPRPAPADLPASVKVRDPPATGCECTSACRCYDCSCAKAGPCVPGCTCARDTSSAAPTPTVEQSSSDKSSDPLPGGVQPEHLSNREVTTINGKEVSLPRAIEALYAGNIPPYLGYLRVLVIDADASRRKMVQGELSKLPECKDVVVQAIPPDHWHLKDRDGKQVFYTAGSPTIYMLAPDGEVLHRQDDYQGGVESTAGALRKARSEYDSRKDPDRRKPQPPGPTPEPIPAPSPSPLPTQVPTWLVIAGIGTIIILFLRRQQ